MEPVPVVATKPLLSLPFPSKVLPLWTVIFPEAELRVAVFVPFWWLRTSTLLRVMFPLLVTMFTFDWSPALNVKSFNVRLPTQGFPDVPMVIVLFEKFVCPLKEGERVLPFQPPCRMRLNPFRVSKSPPVSVELVIVSDPPEEDVK